MQRRDLAGASCDHRRDCYEHGNQDEKLTGHRQRAYDRSDVRQDPVEFDQNLGRKQRLRRRSPIERSQPISVGDGGWLDDDRSYSRYHLAVPWRPDTTLLAVMAVREAVDQPDHLDRD